MNIMVRWGILCLLVVTNRIVAKEHYIFVHGTVMPGICLLTNPFSVYQQQIPSNCCYLQTLQQIRHNTLLYESVIMQDLGLQEIDLNNLAPHQQYAAYQIAYAFKKLGVSSDANYYTFGWLGELSIQARKEAGKKLYEGLCSIKETDPDAHFILMAHSHGGNVVAYLPTFEAVEKKEIVVDQLFLCATPMQLETIHYFLDPLFKQVYNLHSLKDVVQIGDTTVPSRCSYRLFSDLIDTTQHAARLVDVQIKIHNKHLFGHRSFFYFGQYVLPYFTFLRFGHHKALHLLDPLPLVALVPMIQQLLPRIPHKCTHLVIKMRMHHEDWYLEAHCKKNGVYRTPSYTKQLREIKNYLEHHWRPIACTNEIFKNCMAAATALKNRFCFW